MMTIHTLHAGNGYEYLTRQVARGDEVRPRGESLTAYYNAHGNPPGRWVGTGTTAMGVSGAVDAAQMLNLFGTGAHPDNQAQMLGRPFQRRREWEDDPYLVAVEQAFARFAAENDRTPRAGGERDRIRRQVATEILRQDLDGSEPSEPEVGRYLAQRRRTDREGVSGFDLVFTPPKSVSVLWGLADDEVREQISQAHAHAWQDTLAWIEQQAAVTRTGKGGLKQVNTKGLTAAAFDHLDSRAGDPNLHTHVAVSAKVMAHDGQWRSLDARVLFALTVAASERYNALVEEQLITRLGVRFEATPRAQTKVPVREIAGVGSDLVELFSQRRRAITASYNDLVAQYRDQHGHEPSRSEQYRLAQEATLATRAAKEAGAPLSQRVLDWRARALSALGSSQALDARLARVLARPNDTGSLEFDQDQLTQETATALLDRLGRRRATWTEFNVLAEATRLVRELPPVINGSWTVVAAAQAVTGCALTSSLQLSVPEQMSPPAKLARDNGESVYTPRGTTRYTSMQVLGAESELLQAAQTHAGYAVPVEVFETAAADLQIDDEVRLDASQLQMARRFACDPAQLVVGIGPAGAGKTTAMRAFVAAVIADGGRVVAVGPSAVSAQVLGDELGVTAETMHKLIAQHQQGVVPGHLKVDERTVLLVDEAGMAGTLELQEVLALARRTGASVRLLGDPGQLDAVGAGGALRMIANTVGAAELRDIYRFRNPGEDVAGLLLREGRTSGLDYYIDEARVHTGSREAALEELHASWAEDTDAGLNSIMIAASNEDVTYLNERARMRRVTDKQVTIEGVTLRDGTVAGVGDIVVSRHNDRMLRHGDTDYVKNGDLWIVTGRRGDGAVAVRHRQHGTRTVLPASYVRAHVQLGYATTVHRCQGMTVDVSRMLIDTSLSREHLYTGLTRGRHTNHVYVVTEELLDTSLHHQARPDQAARAALETVLARSTVGEGAMSTMVDELESAASLATLVPSYEDAYATALDPEGVERISEAVLAAYGPDLAGAITGENTWPQLAALLYRHQRCGARLPDLLARHGADLDRTRTPAVTLRWRVGDPVPVAGDDRLPEWITPAPADPARSSTAEHAQAAAEPSPHAARVLHVNELAYAYWAGRSPTAWASDYLGQRRLDPEHVVAPTTRAGLVEHLRAQPIADDDILASGLARQARTGRLVDRLRDRIVIPVHDSADRLIAFTARANPDTADDSTPKWLNPPTTAAYNKSTVLLGLDQDATVRLRAGARPVFVEGAFDVAAINQLNDPGLVPLAPCGTAITAAHLEQVRALTPGTMRAIFAFDADRAGRGAALRAWGHLRDAEASTATQAILPTGMDPASVLAEHGPDKLYAGLTAQQLLAEALIDQHIPADHSTLADRVRALRAASSITARLDDEAYTAAGDYLASRLTPADNSGVSRQTVWSVLAEERAHYRIRCWTSASTTEDPAVAAWLRDRADLISDRLDVLTHRLRHHRPAWATDFPPAPAAHTPASDTWEQHVRQIVAYRDRFQIVSHSPLGAAQPADTPQGRARAVAQASLTALGVTNTAPRAATHQFSEGERSLRREQMEQHLRELHHASDPTNPLHPLARPDPGDDLSPSY